MEPGGKFVYGPWRGEGGTRVKLVSSDMTGTLLGTQRNDTHTPLGVQLEKTEALLAFRLTGLGYTTPEVNK